MVARVKEVEPIALELIDHNLEGARLPLSCQTPEVSASSWPGALLSKTRVVVQILPQNMDKQGPKANGSQQRVPVHLLWYVMKHFRRRASSSALCEEQTPEKCSPAPKATKATANSSMKSK
jgi:hypothetical protein